jgi:hypothetical protein
MPTSKLNISCARCGTHIVEYKKQGSGRLVRIYLDHILSFGPGIDPADASKCTSLNCPECEHRLGTRVAEEKGRPAFRLIQGTFRRKKSG